MNRSVCIRSARIVSAAFFFGLTLAVPFAVAQQSDFGTGGPVTVHVGTSDGTIDLHWRDGSLIQGLASSVTLVDGRTLTTTDYTTHTVVVGQVRELTVYHKKAGLPEFIQHIWFPAGKPWVEVQSELSPEAGRIGTRHFEAVVVKEKDSLHLQNGTALRVLHVPYDNDMWFRFNSVALSNDSKDVTSNEVTTIYDNDSRAGFVLGSITHDVWKTEIQVHADQGKIEGLDVFGGSQGSLGERTDTHDFVPHGVVKGAKVTSPRVMVGEFGDWREGLEAYGKRNAEIQPPLSWTGPRPLGWNSWAAYADKINHQRYIGAAQFVHDKLEPEGFSRRVIYINFDAFWSSLDGVSLQDAARTIESLPPQDGAKFEPGIYWTPFAAWTNNLDSFVEGTNGKYRYRDILLKGPDGQPLPKVDGGRPIDPSHPGARMRTRFYVDALAKMGFKYLKIDFLSHGALEGSHYDPAVQTGTEAYNLGMKDLIDTNSGRMFISLSIAPLFPSGYGHARRLSCDTKGHINGKEQSTEYMLNALTYGWWTDGSLYITDPDHVVLGEKADQGARNLTEARSRLLSAIISGGMILDSTRLADDPNGQELAEQVYSNRALMKIAGEGKIFRPIEGDTGDSAASVFARRSPRGYYIAVFNYDDKQQHSFQVDLHRLDAHLTATAARDVASGTAAELSGNTLEVNLTPAESRLIEVVGDVTTAQTAVTRKH